MTCKGLVLARTHFFGLRFLGTTPNEGMGITVSVLLHSRGLGRRSVQSMDSESRRLAICIAGGRARDGNPWLSSPISNDGSMTGSLQLRDYPGEIIACRAYRPISKTEFD